MTASSGAVLTFITCLAVGITMVVGVNALNSAPSYMLNYYKYVVGDADAVPGNEKFWQTVLTFYQVVTMVTQTIFSPINLTTFCCRFSVMFRLTVSSVLMLIELLVVLVLPISSTVSENGAMAALMIMAFVGGVGRAFYENTGYALIGPCPTIMMTAVMSGVSVSGVLTSVLQIIIKASMADDFDSVKIQSYIYFSLGIAVIVVTMVLLILLSRNSFAKKYVAEFRSKRGFFANIYRNSKKTAVPEPAKVEFPEYAGNGVADGKVPPTTNTIVEENKEEEVELTTAELIQSVKLWPVIKLIYPMQFSCFFTYFITYLLFPGVMLAVDYDDPWYGTIVMAVFNAADLTGRLLCLIKSIWPPRKWVVIGTMLRLILFPLMILCATHHIPTHAAAYVIAFCIGMSGGFIGTLSMTYTPETEGIVTNGERALAGQASGACLLLGIASGALLQLPIMLKL